MAYAFPTPSERMDPAMSHDLILMKESGRVCTLSLNRPEKKNSLYALEALEDNDKSPYRRLCSMAMPMALPL
jgi:hypothetical protein